MADEHRVGGWGARPRPFVCPNLLLDVLSQVLWVGWVGGWVGGKGEVGHGLVLRVEWVGKAKGGDGLESSYAYLEGGRRVLQERLGHVGVGDEEGGDVVTALLAAGLEQGQEVLVQGVHVCGFLLGGGGGGWEGMSEMHARGRTDCPGCIQSLGCSSTRTVQQGWWMRGLVVVQSCMHQFPSSCG